MKNVTLIMKVAALSLIAAVLTLLFFYSKQQDANVKSSARETVPAFSPGSARPLAAAWSGVDDTGKKIDLAALRGRIVHVVFWAQWCAPCRLELPALNKIFKERGGSYQVLLFNMDDNDTDRDAARKLLKKLAPDLTAIYKEARPYADLLKVEALPYHYVIDKSGHVAATFISSVTDDLPAFKKLLDSLQ